MSNSDDEDRQDRREKELRFKEQKKLMKKNRKKSEKKKQERNSKEIEAIMQTCDRVLERLKKVDDMNLRCYMFLEKIATMLDIGLATTVLGDIPDESYEKIKYYFENLHNEIGIIMKWVINERQVSASVELTNPIPEDAPIDRRRRIRDNT